MTKLFCDRLRDGGRERKRERQLTHFDVTPRTAAQNTASTLNSLNCWFFLGDLCNLTENLLRNAKKLSMESCVSLPRWMSDFSANPCLHLHLPPISYFQEGNRPIAWEKKKKKISRKFETDRNAFFTRAWQGGRAPCENRDCGGDCGCILVCQFENNDIFLDFFSSYFTAREALSDASLSVPHNAPDTFSSEKEKILL